jgi:hypothetical protein
MMNRINIAALILASLGLAGFMIPAASADIYSWVDENGVRHFTNQSPPKHAELLIKSPEVTYDEEADQRRVEEDKLELARQELAEKEALLLQQQLEAERRLAAANDRAEAAIEQADQILQEAEAAAEAYENDRWRSNGYYYPYYRIGHRKHYISHYRHKGLYRKHPYKYRQHPYAYGDNTHKRHSLRDRLYTKHHSKGLYHNRYDRTHRIGKHQSLTQGRYPSHRARSSAFRGRHGRF